jgi:hypothetical protein
MHHELPYAEDCNYWKSGQSSPDTWLARAVKQIEGVGGAVLGEAFGRDATTGRAAYMLQFAISRDHFKLVWPVLPTRTGNEKAARIQAVTMLYHDVKARCVSAKVLGARATFFTFLQLPDGRSAAEASAPELVAALPAMFRLLEGDRRNG